MQSAPNNGRTAVVVGGGRGIGAATAFALGKAGFNVVVAARSRDELSNVERELRKLYPKQEFRSSIMDARDDDLVKTMFEDCNNYFGRLDALVNCQGIAMLGDLRQTTPRDFEHLAITNLVSVYRCIYHAVPMLETSRGSIVTVISRAARQVYPNAIGYGSTKAALVYLTQAVSLAMAKEGVRVYGICPGAVNTKMRADLFPDEDPTSLMQPEVVADAIVGLLQPHFAFANGAVLDFPW